jgi:hypothetical protein
LQNIRDAKTGLEGVGGLRIAEIVCEDTLADQAGDAAQQNPGRDQNREIRAPARPRFRRRGARFG